VAHLLDLTTGSKSEIDIPKLAGLPPLLRHSLNDLGPSPADLDALRDALTNIEPVPSQTLDAIVALNERVDGLLAVMQRQARDARATTRLTWMLAVLTLAVLVVTVVR
jgi:hypothetical protein